MIPSVSRWVVTMVVIFGVLVTLSLSNSGALALHIQPRVLSDHWLGSPLSDTTDTTDQISTTPQEFDTTDVFPTTVIPTTTEAVLESDTLPPFLESVIPKSSGLPWETDVDELIINIPNPVCPVGYRSDYRGKCRQIFRFQLSRDVYQEPMSPGSNPFIVQRQRPHSNALL
ncbi:uncharacterized protein LOC123505091 [Portunus trituberculatus]|uniref:uncharacterized protein LOC123505091 n=1 Tax=Portunus trituberculatus TaxID=210409 RepID=UPI001E1CF39D|nr:uncharacterized protein LOC123505091 [Portunus trituberculatus]